MLEKQNLELKECLCVCVCVCVCVPALAVLAVCVRCIKAIWVHRRQDVDAGAVE